MKVLWWRMTATKRKIKGIKTESENAGGAGGAPEGVQDGHYALCLPLASKSASEVLAGAQELYGLLMKHGYPVARVHTDAAESSTMNLSDVQPTR